MDDIRTARLTLRRFSAADLPALVAYRSDPDVARYQGWESPFSPADAQRFLHAQRTAVLGVPGEWVQLAAVDRADGSLVGDCAVRIVADQPSTAELGITVAPDRQRAGLATEIVTGVLAALFGELGVHRVYAVTDDRNDAVHRLLERVGMRCEARLVEADWFKGEWSTVRTYAVLRREWVTRRP